MTTDETQQAEARRGPGQPTLFREKYIEQAYKLTLLGATDEELGDFFGVSKTTIENWKLAFPEFFDSIKRGKSQADAEVAEKLYERAKGYSHPEERIFCHEGEIIRTETVRHYPPDTGAACMWLKNRRKQNWRDSHDITTDGEPITPQVVNFADLLKPQPPATPTPPTGISPQ